MFSTSKGNNGLALPNKITCKNNLASLSLNRKHNAQALISSIAPTEPPIFYAPNVAFNAPINRDTQSKNNSLIILHQNIRFALNKKVQLEVLVSELEPDILCLSEFALWKEEVEHYCLSGYELITFYCREQADRGGGIGMFVSDRYSSSCKIINIEEFCLDKHFEACCIQFSYHNDKYIIISLYRTPGSGKAEVDIFVESLIDVLEHISSSNKLIVLGDTNINTLVSDYRWKRLEEVLFLFDLCSVVNLPTREASAIDSIFTNIQLGSFKTEVHQTGLSDHHAVSITISLKFCKQEKKGYIRVFDTDSINSFLFFLQEQSWERVIENGDVNNSYNNFQNILDTL